MHDVAQIIVFMDFLLGIRLNFSMSTRRDYAFKDIFSLVEIKLFLFTLAGNISCPNLLSISSYNPW